MRIARVIRGAAMYIRKKMYANQLLSFWPKVIFSKKCGSSKWINRLNKTIMNVSCKIEMGVDQNVLFYSCEDFLLHTFCIFLQLGP